MKTYAITKSPTAHKAVRRYDSVAGAVLGVMIAAVLVEGVLMIPDLIRTVKIHLM